MVAVVEDDLVLAQVPLEADGRGRPTRDPGDLLAGLERRRRAVDADDPTRPPARVLEHREAGDHPGLRRARDGADDDRVEEHAELPLLLRDLHRPAGEAVAAQRMVRGARRDRVGRAARRPHVGQRLLPALLEADAEARPGRGGRPRP